jgi:hypothetical protein
LNGEARLGVVEQVSLGIELHMAVGNFPARVRQAGGSKAISFGRTQLPILSVCKCRGQGLFQLGGFLLRRSARAEIHRQGQQFRGSIVPGRPQNFETLPQEILT